MSESRRPHLLLTNDDGIHAPGLRALADALAPNYDLLIVAPHRERSATGHAITVLRNLKLEKVIRDDRHWGWSFEGRPADCVKIALTRMELERPIDLVLSGINMGQNLGVNIHYSGTVAAAREAAINGVPSIAFSLAYRDVSKMDFAGAAKVALDLTRKFSAKHHKPNVFLNVNIPPIPYEEIKGTVITRQGDSGFRDRFERVAHPEENAHSIFRNVGERFAPSSRNDHDMDDHAVKAGKVSITPLHVDTTAHHALDHFRDLES